MIYGIEYRKGLLFIRLEGRLNKNKTNILKSKINNYMEKYGIKYFVINISKLLYISPFAKLALEKEINNHQIIICDDNDDINCFKINKEIDAFKIIKI